MIYNHLKKLKAALAFNSDCLICQMPVDHVDDRPKILCGYCHQQLPLIQSSCPVCALPLPKSQSSACGECLKNTPPFGKTVAAFHYEPPVSDFISQLKFNGQRQLLPLLSDYLLKKIHLDYQQDELPQQLIAIPLHPHKLRQRGFNQAQLLAGRLAKSLSIKAHSSAVLRQRDTVPQVSLDAIQRQRNLKGAFKVVGPLAAHIAIVDDVMTTATTVTELAQELRSFGCQRVDVWCLARAYHVN